MSKIARKTQLIFGSSASVGDIAKFASYAAGGYLSSTDPAVIQALAGWLTGWYGAVVDDENPLVEDMNSVCFVFAYQLAYLMQAGIAEWDSGTTYYKGSLVNSSGVVYVSLTDTNLNNAITDTVNWKPQSSNVVTINPSTQSPYALAATDNGTIFLVQSANAAMQFNLPAASGSFNFTVQDRDGNFTNNPCTIHRAAAEKIQRIASDYVAQANFGKWVFECDATDWSF